MTAPCFDCTDRAIGCHGKCERYAGYQKSCDIIAQEQRKRRNDPARDFLIDGVKTRLKK